MSEIADWQPSASIANLLKKAKIVSNIRRFFADRGVLEVETPMMSQATVTDIHLCPFETQFVGPGASQGLKLYLMTSPEYHMKRLLAANSGPIYQMGRCFRNEEAGRYHNPEFTMLEWYRPCFDMYRLMNEVDDLLQEVLDCEASESLSYQQAFCAISISTLYLQIKKSYVRLRQSLIYQILLTQKKIEIRYCNYFLCQV